MKHLVLLIGLIGCSNSDNANQDKSTSKVTSGKAKAEVKTKDSHADHTGHGSKAASDASIGTVPKNAKVFFKSPQNGAVVKSPVQIEMGVEGMVISPAAAGLKEGTGHHHVIIDTLPPTQGNAIPMDDKHKHFGKGQTNASIELSPGKHTLHLQFANAAHISYGKQMSATIEITVEK